LARATDEAALFHAIEEAGHVRVVRNHPVADNAAGETIGLGAAKDAEHIILRAGEAVGLEELFSFEAEGVGGFLERDEDAVLEGKEGMPGRTATHEAKIVVVTTNVKRKEFIPGGRTWVRGARLEGASASGLVENREDLGCRAHAAGCGRADNIRREGRGDLLTGHDRRASRKVQDDAALF